jgi:hypothetical protein
MDGATSRGVALSLCNTQMVFSPLYPLKAGATQLRNENSRGQKSNHARVTCFEDHSYRIERFTTIDVGVRARLEFRHFQQATGERKT